MKEKNILVASWSHKVVYFQMLVFETSNYKSEVLKTNSWKITSFSKIKSLQKVSHNGDHHYHIYITVGPLIMKFH